jgi:hypothetical protein
VAPSEEQGWGAAAERHEAQDELHGAAQARASGLAATSDAGQPRLFLAALGARWGGGS